MWRGSSSVKSALVPNQVRVERESTQGSSTLLGIQGRGRILLMQVGVHIWLEPSDPTSIQLPSNNIHLVSLFSRILGPYDPSLYDMFGVRLPWFSYLGAAETF